MTGFDSERPFSIWSYTVSHRQLLLRSTRQDHALGAPDLDTQIDVLFKNVTALKLASRLTELKLREVRDEQASDLINDAAIPCEPRQHVISVRGGAVVGWVICGVVAVDEWAGDYSDPSRVASGRWSGPVLFGGPQP